MLPLPSGYEPGADFAHSDNWPLAYIRPGYDKTSPQETPHIPKQSAKQRKRTSQRIVYTLDRRSTQSEFQSHQGHQGQSRMPEPGQSQSQGFVEILERTESGGAALEERLPIANSLGQKGITSRAKLNIRRSRDPFRVSRPFGSLIQGECWIPGHVWLPTRQLWCIGYIYTLR